MREIKFRGKALNGEKWYYGSLIDYGDPTFCDIVYFTSNNDAVHEPVDINTIGQFTGLHDKNGKEIYEGDILKDCWADGSVGIELVGFENGSFGSMDNYAYQYLQKGYKYPRFNHKFLYCMFDGTAKNFISVEVIGNVHDNPELLKGGEE